MEKRHRLTLARLALILTALFVFGVGQSRGESAAATPAQPATQATAPSAQASVPCKTMRCITQAQRRASAQHAAARRAAVAAQRKAAQGKTSTVATPMTPSGAVAGSALSDIFVPPGCPAPVMNPGGFPDYMSGCVANNANSQVPTDALGTGGIRKFVDPLPNIPVAVPDKHTYPGSDYYEISLVEYTQKMHSDLNPTLLRGYVQTNNGMDENGGNIVAPAPVQYLGPMIIAQKNRPVRVKFTNKLPIGAGGDLFIPVDTTVMGSGVGPNGSSYTQNRANLHMHGGNTPWISDGTPHQWTTPAGENTSYPKGVSVVDVPDMPPTGPGEMTFFYTNQQSARLMWYHDHAYGITRLNVYAGMASAYLLTDDIEQTLINGGTFTANGAPVTVAPGTIPADQIPLVLQDKTFIPSPEQLAAQDPTWNWGPKDTNGNFQQGNLCSHTYTCPTRTRSMSRVLTQWADGIGVRGSGRRWIRVR